MDTALRHIVTAAEGDGHGVHRDANLLEDAMKGMGTKDERLSAYTLLSCSPLVAH